MAGENHANLDAVCAARVFHDAPCGDGKAAGYGGFHDFASSNGYASAFADACAACGYAVSLGGGEFPYACAPAYRNAHAAPGHGIACPDAAPPNGDALPNGHRGAANGYCRAACRHPTAHGHGCAPHSDVDAHGYPSAAHGDANAANAYAGGVWLQPQCRV